MDSFYRRILWALGAILICAILYGLVRLLRRKPKTKTRSEGLELPGKGEKLVLSEDIRTGQTGSLSYRGSVWAARNESGRDLQVGETVLVERVEPSHTLVVTAFSGVLKGL